MSATHFESSSKCNQIATHEEILLIVILKDHNLFHHRIKKNLVVVVNHVANVVPVVIGINVEMVRIL